MAGLLQLPSTPAAPHHLLTSPSSPSPWSLSWRSQAGTSRAQPPPIFSAATNRSSRSPHRSTILCSSSSSSSGGGGEKTKTKKKTVTLTYLEINSWVWELPGGFRILVDPILVGNLDFGVPWLFDAAKKRVRVGIDDLLAPPGAVDLLLITQSLDDHCHERTLRQLSAAAPRLPVVATPNAQPILGALPFRDVTYLEPGESTAIARGEASVRILATAGPVLGPPWQRPENGYIVAGGGGDGQQGWGEQEAEGVRLYYEPHCVYDRPFLESRALRADVVVTPVVKQRLPANFTLVSGQEDAVELAGLLGARYVVPMSNGDVDAKGLLTAVLSTQGTLGVFKAQLAAALPGARVLEPTPGVPLHLDLESEPQPSAAAAAT